MMKALRRIALYGFAAIAVIAVLLYVVATHGSTQIAMTCEGSWVKSEKVASPTTETAYVVLELYKPWLFWFEGDGSMRAETKAIAFHLYAGRVLRTGSAPLENLMFFGFANEMVGAYRSGPNEMTLEFANGFVFVGDCVDGI